MEYLRLDNILNDKAECPEGENGPEDTIPTGLPSLDSIAGGFQAGKLYVIGGRPGMGKTSLMLQMAKNIASDADHRRPVYIHSLEKSAEQIAERMRTLVFNDTICSMTSSGCENGGAVGAANKKLSSLPIYICDDPSGTANDLCSFCEKLSGGILFIDYLQLLSGVSLSIGEDRNRHHTENLILRMLSDSAKSNNISIVLLSQVSRRVEAGKDKRPQPGDLFQCNGDISGEYIMLYRSGYYNLNPEDNTAELIAYSNGEKIGTAECLWDSRKLLFMENEKAEAPDAVESCDTLEFRTFAPQKAGEDQAMEIDDTEPVAGIYINGMELVDILRPLEDLLKDPDDECESGGYGHLTAEDLYTELKMAEAIPEEKAHLLCCRNCGDIFCWSVEANVEMTEHTVEWTLVHNHRNWDYGRRYVFQRDEYEQALDTLKGLE